MLNNFGKRIRFLREQKGISLNEFAKKLIVSSGYLSNLETGKTETIPLSLLKNCKRNLLYFQGTLVSVKADDKIPNIAGIKFPTYNRTIVSMRGAMVRDYERGIFYDQRDV